MFGNSSPIERVNDVPRQHFWASQPGVAFGRRMVMQIEAESQGFRDSLPVEFPIYSVAVVALVLRGDGGVPNGFGFGRARRGEPRRDVLPSVAGVTARAGYRPEARAAAGIRQGRDCPIGNCHRLAVLAR